MKFQNLILFIFIMNFTFSQKQKIYYYDDLNLIIKKTDLKENMFLPLDSLVKKGYFTLEKDSILEKNKEIFIFFKKGKFYKSQKVELDSLAQKALNKNFIESTQIDSSLQIIKKYYLENGFPFVQVKNNNLIIETKLLNKRFFDNFVYQGKVNLAKTYKKQLESKYLGSIYSPSNLKLLIQTLNLNEYFKTSKNPQVLFTQDSTKIYLYLENKKNNYFDGILGVNSDSENKIKLTGNVQLHLQNILGGFERINLEWQSSAQESTQLKTSVYVPYVIKKYLGLQTEIAFFKQDSTYANIKLSQKFFHQLSENQNIGINLSFENSNYLIAQNPSLNYQDFSKSGIGILYQFKKLRDSKLMPFEHRLFFDFNSLTNKRQEKSTLNQYELSLFWDKLFELKPNKLIYTKINTYTLLSDEYSQNELKNIGGVHSIRGFNENIFLVNTYLINTLEYRYLVGENLFLNVFSDFGWIQNKAIKQESIIYSFGGGLGFLSSIGIISINYALGKTNQTNFEFSQSKIHIGITSYF